jgi:CelD/BcsL family acetyltransferase involved in cellulose biosynthesis
VKTHEEFEAAWPLFIDLHQLRRQSLGEPGCFADPTFTQFHNEVAPLLLTAGRLRLSWLALDGEPVAAEYHFAGDGVTYAYQGGVDPARLDDEPGRLSNIATLRAAIAEGHAAFDFLRGDEPYKAHWRATPHATVHVRISPPSHRSNWLAQTVDWADSVASAVKAGLRPIASSGLPSF